MLHKKLTIFLWNKRAQRSYGLTIAQEAEIRKLEKDHGIQIKISKTGQPQIQLNGSHHSVIDAYDSLVTMLTRSNHKLLNESVKLLGQSVCVRLFYLSAIYPVYN